MQLRAKVVVRAGKRSKLWVTFNEPGVAAMCGFITGNHPPGQYLNFPVRLPTNLSSFSTNSAAEHAACRVVGADEARMGYRAPARR